MNDSTQQPPEQARPRTAGVRRITEFPHLSMTPENIGELEERRKDEEDPAFSAGMKWAREQNLNAPVPGDEATEDEWFAIHAAIKAETDRRYPDDVVSESRFLEGAQTWAGLLR